MKLPDINIAYFFELETSLHKKEIRNSADATSALLADAFIEFGSSGKVWDKASIVESMRREKPDPQISVEDFNARELAPGVSASHIYQQGNCRGSSGGLHFAKFDLETLGWEMADDFSSGDKNLGIPSRMAGNAEVSVGPSPPPHWSRNGLDDFVAAKASGFTKSQQFSTSSSQQVQYQSVANSRFQQSSIRSGIWFGTMVGHLGWPCGSASFFEMEREREWSNTK